jgi:hypothetical protein
MGNQKNTNLRRVNNRNNRIVSPIYDHQIVLIPLQIGRNDRLCAQRIKSLIRSEYEKRCLLILPIFRVSQQYFNFIEMVFLVVMVDGAVRDFL